MVSGKYVRALVLKRKEKGRVAGLASARARKARVVDGAVRVSRVVRIAIQDSHRPGVVLTLQRDDRGDGRWGRWRVDGYETIRLASSGIGKLLAWFLE
jgi:hypothetical protein